MIIYNELNLKINTKEQKTSRFSGTINHSDNSASLGLSYDNEALSEYSLFAKPQIDNLQFLFKNLKKRKNFLVIDDFHKIKEEEFDKIIDLFKIFADSTTDDEFAPKIICIANYTKEIERFLQLNKKHCNKFSLIEIPSFSRDELKSIIVNGFKILKIELKEESIKDILNNSQNSASEVHQLCLDICKTGKIKRKSFCKQELKISIFKCCIDSFIRRNKEKLLYVYHMAISDPLSLYILEALRLNKFLSFENLKKYIIGRYRFNFDDNELNLKLERLASIDFRLVSYNKQYKTYKIAHHYWLVFLREQSNYGKIQENQTKLPRLLNQDTSEAMIENVMLNAISEFQNK